MSDGSEFQVCESKINWLTKINLDIILKPMCKECQKIINKPLKNMQK